MGRSVTQSAQNGLPGRASALRPGAHFLTPVATKSKLALFLGSPIARRSRPFRTPWKQYRGFPVKSVRARSGKRACRKSTAVMASSDGRR